MKQTKKLKRKPTTTDNNLMKALADLGYVAIELTEEDLTGEINIDQFLDKLWDTLEKQDSLSLGTGEPLLQTETTYTLH